MKLIGPRLFVTLRIVCAVALVSIGFAQNAHAGNRVVPVAELAQYVLPDGSLPELCITLADGSGSGKIVRLGADTMGAHHHDALWMPKEAGGPFVLQNAGQFFPPNPVIVRHKLHPPGSGPRAPPQSLTFV